MGRRPDLLAVVEAGYRLAGDDDTWLGEVARAVGRALAPGRGLWAMRFSVPRTTSLPGPDGFVTLDLSDEEVAWVQAGFSCANAGHPEHVRRTASLRFCDTLSGMAARSPDAARLYGEFARPRDLLGVNAVGDDGQGVLFAMPLAEPTTVSPGMARLWCGLAGHLAAGERLRRTLGGITAGQRPNAAEAVLDVDGTTVHAEGLARAGPARDALRRAVRALDRARTRRARVDAVEAASLWPGLVEGRWSLVDRFDADGRRYVVAWRNEPLAPDPRALTARERQVLAALGEGVSDKAIAWELGLTRSAVASHVASIRRKLGARSRGDLVRVARTLAAPD